MRHGSLFSGIGGFDLAAEWMGWENVFQVEKDSFCQKVLAKNFPNTARYGDIKEFDGTKYTGRIDVLSGGFPCQPFSVAGDQKGQDDNRYLWPEMFRVIREVKPSFIVGENVTGIIDLALSEILTSLEDQGYRTETFIIPASAVGAIHKRDRVWIVAYSDSVRLQRSESWLLANPGRESINSTVLPAGSFLKGNENELPAPYITRGNDGIPNRMDRIKGLGNAIVPQVAYEIFKAIEQINNG